MGDHLDLLLLHMVLGMEIKHNNQHCIHLCRHYFDKGIPNALLFTRNDNVAAQKVYASLGFKPDGQFVIAEY